MRSRYVFALALLPALLSVRAGATVYVVSPDATIGDFPTIQAAVDAIVDGDIIELISGTFVGPGNRDIDFLGKAITVRSQDGDPAACIVNCQGSPSEQHRAFWFHSGEGSSSQVQELTLSNGYAEQGGAILCQASSSPTITGCVFSHNRASGEGGALLCEYYSDVTVEHCTFKDNSASKGGAASACYQAFPSFWHSTFSENSAEEGGAGIHV
jgi:hypothetical protein